MAQIVTITNPLTGQPAQVDQLDHTAQQIDDAIARALPGGGIDTLLAGKAPAGFGLGGNGKRVTDMNNAQESGFYSALGASNLPPNVESVQYGSVLVLCSQADRVTQVYFQDVTGGTGAIAVRRLNGDGWSVWEFINPPMVVDNEYRTTERHNGGIVFAKAMTYTFTSSYDSASQFGLEIPHEISNFGSLVRAEAVSPPYMIPYVSKNGGFAGVRAVNATNILFDSYKTSWSSGNKITFKLFYTKS